VVIKFLGISALVTLIALTVLADAPASFSPNVGPGLHPVFAQDDDPDTFDISVTPTDISSESPSETPTLMPTETATSEPTATNTIEPTTTSTPGI